MASKPQANAPISRHPLFPAAVALWFAALLGLGSIAIRSSVLERIVLALHLDLVIPAAAPPLGFTARMLLALILAGGGGVAGFFLARRMAESTLATNRTTTRLRTPTSPTVIVPSVSTFVGEAENEDEDLARLEAARQDQPRRRRPLALAEETRPAEMHEFAPLPGGRPTILNIGELDTIPPLGDSAELEEIIPPMTAAPAYLPTPDDEPVIAPVAAAAPLPEPAPAPEPVAAPKRQGPPALAPLPLAASAPAVGTAATRLRETPLEALGVVELVERFALALEGRRERDSVDQAAHTDSAPMAAPVPAVAESFAPTAPVVSVAELATAVAPQVAAEAEPKPDWTADDQFTRLFDMPAALRTPGLDQATANGWTSDWFTKTRVAATPTGAPAMTQTLADGSTQQDASSAEDDFEETDEADDGFSSLLDLKPSIRTANAESVAMHQASHIKGSAIPGAIVPGAAFGNSPAETEQALREALAALQRMSGAA